MKRRLSPEERALWRRVVRDIAPLPKTPAPAAPEERNADVGARRPAAPAPGAPKKAVGAPRPAAKSSDPFTAGDPGLERKARRGRIPIDATLDLHGMTQGAAKSALYGFLTSARSRSLRCVLVVTGKGARYPASTAPGRGVLKARAREWLREEVFRQHVSRAGEAHPRHGGSGAFYVFLKSPSTKRRGK